MPDPKSDELAARSDVCWTAKAFLDGTADKASLRLSVNTWLARRDKLSKQAFRSTRSGNVALSDAEASQRTVAKQPQEQLETELGGTKPPNEPPKTPATAGPEGRPSRSWLRAYGVAWVARFGGIPPWGLMGAVLKPLVVEHGDDLVLRRWTNFLTASTATYVNVWRFQYTFGQWDTPDPDAWQRDPMAPRPGESTDAYIARLTRP